ncbi:MAG: hypothetical protein ACRBFS_21755 [Aureispira sp.]
MSVNVKFWDVSELKKTGLELLEVAKNRVGSNRIKKKDGTYTVRHKELIDNWVEAGFLRLSEEGIKLSAEVVPYDFSEEKNRKEEVTKYLQAHEIAFIEAQFREYQTRDVAQEALVEIYPALLKAGIFINDKTDTLSPSTLCGIGCLMEEIRTNCMGRSNRKGVMQYHQRCDFDLWLMLQLGLIRKAYSDFNKQEYYVVEEQALRALKKALEPMPYTKPSKSTVETKEPTKQIENSEPTALAEDKHESQALKDKIQQLYTDFLADKAIDPNSEGVRILLAAGVLEIEASKNIKLAPAALEKAVDVVLCVRSRSLFLLQGDLATFMAKEILGMLRIVYRTGAGYLTVNEELLGDLQKPYEFIRYIGGQRPPVHKRLVVVADLDGRGQDLILFETSFKGGKYNINPEALDSAKVLYWTVADWAEEEPRQAFNPAYDDYLEIDLNGRSYAKEVQYEHSKDRQLAVDFCPAIQQAEMRLALRLYKQNKGLV